MQILRRTSKTNEGETKSFTPSPLRRRRREMFFFLFLPYISRFYSLFFFVCVTLQSRWEDRFFDECIKKKKKMWRKLSVSQRYCHYFPACRLTEPCFKHYHTKHRLGPSFTQTPYRGTKYKLSGIILYRHISAAKNF